MAGGVVPILWLQEGCQGSYPPIAVMVVTSTPTLMPDVVSNFETGGTAVNSNLTGVNGYPGSFSANTYGGSPPNTINNPFIVSNPGDGSNFALHISTSLSSTGAYEADQVFCNLKSPGASSPYFDLTPFTGIRFDFKLGADTNPASGRVFGIPIDITTVPSSPGGTCTSQCYNNFQVNLPAGQNTAWMPLTFTWSQFAEAYNQLTPPQNQFSNHLTRALQLEWSFSPNAAIVTTTTTDFWVDNVQFLP